MAAGGPPRGRPIGVTLAATAKHVSRAFDDALAAAGGTRPTWLILLALRSGPPGTQRELAERVGIRGATLTHHLEGMEAAGLVRRERLEDDRRTQRVELTEAGEAAFARLRDVAVAFDARLRDGLDDVDVDRLRALLDRLHGNVG